MTIQANYDKAKKKVWTGEARLSFPSLYQTARNQMGEDTGKYSATLLIPKTDKKSFEMITAALNDAIAEAFGTNKPKGLKLPLKDGDKMAEEKGRDETVGMWVVTASSKDQPGVLDRKAKIIVTKERREELARKAESSPEASREFEKYSELDDRDVYAGCWVRATLNPFVWGHKTKNPGGVGVSFGLQNIQKLRDDESFSGKAKATSDFEAVDAEEKESYSGSDDDKLAALMG